jgi:hypothetical protein
MRGVAVEAMAREPTLFRESLLRLADDPYLGVRADAARVLMGQAATALADALKLSRSGFPDVRKIAAAKLVETPKACRKTLLELTRDQNAQVRFLAAQGLTSDIKENAEVLVVTVRASTLLERA